MKKIILAFSLLTFILDGCSDSKTASCNQPTTDIKGTWYLNKWTDYHTLVFNDATVYVDNQVDTVFTLKYLIKADTLIVFAGQPTTQFKNKIVCLTKENLTVDGIGEVKETRTYSREKKEFKNE